MDNYFYDRPQRVKLKKRNENIMTKVIVVQLILSIVISGVLFAICRTDSDLSKGIKAYYNEVCKTDISVSGIVDVFKGVVKDTFSPSIIGEDVF
jgi:hypothetical protein